MKIQQNISLKLYNTFGIEALARHFVEITTVQNLKEVLQKKNYPDKIVLSGGSNVLITNDLNALVIHINIKGITILSEDDNSVILKVMAGENWHDLVLWTIDHDYGGLENLSLIPGNVGTSPLTLAHGNSSFFQNLIASLGIEIQFLKISERVNI